MERIGSNYTNILKQMHTKSECVISNVGESFTNSLVTSKISSTPMGIDDTADVGSSRG